ncbi:type VII secretion-associated serine protease mycosin [Krasilnikovia sp. M28-CT-15]|uniref:type VII secretion-associated serine protease mycosin n=1 Tax=Krasilnikovia sp. M28-CT-15 TaxID=3373540 RepID=UPI0038778A2F
MRRRTPARVPVARPVAALVALVAALTAGAPPRPASASASTDTLVGLPVLDPGDARGGCSPAARVTFTGQPWAQRRLTPQRAWMLTRGAGVTVAVIDSGVDPSVPQLAGHVGAGANLVARGPGDVDCVAHGTFVAGIIAARPVAGVPFAGIAPDARILPLRQTVNGADGSVKLLAAAIRKAVQGGATVVNVSLSAYASSPELEAAVRDAIRHDVLVVAATGNRGDNGNPRPFPASLPGVLAVGALDEKGAVPKSSGTGPFVSLVAPGVDVVSLGRGGPGHLRGSGTSFAAPFVAGVAALVRARYPRLSAVQVKHRLEVTADHPATALPDPTFGYGVVNPMAAVSTVLAEESGPAPRGPVPQVVSLGRPPPPGSPGSGVGLAALAVTVLLAAGGALVRTVAVAGRRRGWRPAGSRPRPASVSRVDPAPPGRAS